jgi:hypothetical protein
MPKLKTLSGRDVLKIFAKLAICSSRAGGLPEDTGEESLAD